MASAHLGLISAAVLFTGCVYTIDTALSDPEPADSALAGRWIAEDGDVADVVTHISHLLRGDDVILTGNTAELSVVLLDLLARPGFTERSVWRRQK